MKHFIIFYLLTLNSFANEINKEKLLELDKQNKALFSEVKNYTDELLTSIEKKKVLIDEKLANWSDDFDSMDGKEINKAIKDAMSIAKANGLDTVKLKKMFELSKKVILRSEFKKYDGDTKSSTAKKFDEWLDWAILGEEKITRDTLKIQRQRVALYKKVNIAFLKALVQKDAKKSLNSFRKYAQALQKIQSADADILIAEAKLLVAEQELVADVSSGLPLVGEAMDIMALATGKDLSGKQLSNFEKGFTFVALVTPEILTQIIKRNPAVAKALGKMGASVKNIPKKVLEKVASKKALHEHLNKLGNVSDEVLRWRRFYDEKIVEAKKLANMSSAKRFTKAKEFEDHMETVFHRRNNLGDELGNQISKTAKKRNEIIITRPTSDDLPDRLAEGAYTKGMNVKGKSADRGIASGYVPVKQKFSKLNDPSEIQKFQRKVDESLETVEVAGTTITPQRVSSKQLIVTRNNIRLEGIEIFKKGSDDSIAVFKTADGKIVTENLEEIGEETLKKYNLKNAKPFKVLTDMNGNYLAADIDLLTVGSKKKATIMQNDELMGNINFNEMGTVDEMNRAMKSSQYPDRQLVHHGGEASFMNKDSVLDFPISAYSPDGKVAVMRSEKEVKDYFHMQKLRGYDLQPNPYWNWGKWDPKVGYK